MRTYPRIHVYTRIHARLSYAKYLNDVLGHFELDIREQTEVLDITPALKEGESGTHQNRQGWIFLPLCSVGW